MKTATATPKHKEDSRLRCYRCDGLMLPVRLYDQLLGFGPMDCWGWRCVVCGELVDPLILQHRRERAVSRHRAESQHQAR